MDVFLFDKVMKTEWDKAGGGAHVVTGTVATMDFIPTNRCVKRVNLPGKMAFTSQPHSVGRAPWTGHKEGSREPLCFDVQIRDEEDLAMLIIPPKFVEVMKEGLAANLMCMVRLLANKWCEF
ncbi:Protein transport protein Sec31A [Hordeum vulgare]|nr:Protein transport protein Sec31A [Hordeum vulgare]